MRVMVTGGRGALGRLVVPRLLAAGHDVVVTSRRPEATAPAGASVRRLDLREPVGPSTFAEIDAIVHAATDPARPRKVDIDGTGRVLAAATEAGVGHLLYPSIVGVDDHPFPYYRGKVGAEQAIASGSVPWTIVRLTQFHEFLDRIFSTGPVVTVFRGLEFQVIDGGVAADHLVALVAAGPQGRADDLGGPRSESMTSMADTWRAATGSRKPRLPVPAVGRIGRAFLSKQHHTPNAAVGTPTWDEWLAATYPPAG